MTPDGGSGWAPARGCSRAMLRRRGRAHAPGVSGSFTGYDGYGQAIFVGVDERALTELLERSSDVSLAYLFGSLARDEARRNSDLDLALLFVGPPSPSRVDEIVVAVERVAGRSVDLVVLNSASPLLTHEVVATGRLLVCRDDSERAAFEARATIRYLDTGHLRRIQHQYLRERAGARRAAAP